LFILFCLAVGAGVGAGVGALVVCTWAGVRLVGARVEVLVAGASVTFSVGIGRPSHPHGSKAQYCRVRHASLRIKPLPPTSWKSLHEPRPTSSILITIAGLPGWSREDNKLKGENNDAKSL
jgi:hypothetical protein